MKATLALQNAPRATAQPSFGAPAYEAAQVEVHRAALLRCAAWLLGSGDAAVCLVDDVMRAAGKELFADPATTRARLFDRLGQAARVLLRERARSAPLRDDSAEDGGDGAPAFLADGHWCEEPSAWGASEDVLAAARFQAALERSIGLLPRNTACVFALREVFGLAPREIAATLGLAPETCASMLCRARLAVHQRVQRECFARAVVQ